MREGGREEKEERKEGREKEMVVVREGSVARGSHKKLFFFISGGTSA